MARNQGPSNDSSPGSRRESGYRGRNYRGRGRGRGYRGKNAHYDESRPQRNYNSNYKGKKSNYHAVDAPEDDVAGLEGRMNMEDLYDDRPVETPDIPSMEGRSLEERISIPNDDHRSRHPEDEKTSEYGNNDGAAYTGYAVARDEPLRSQNPEKDSSHNMGMSSTPSHNKDEAGVSKEAGGTNSKDPEELRQKVLESLAEKKKKAAEFMNLEAEGIKEQVLQNQAQSDNSTSGIKADTGNPERDASINALLATFGQPEQLEVERPGETRRKQSDQESLVETTPQRYERSSRDDGQSSHGDRHPKYRPGHGAKREEGDRYRSDPPKPYYTRREEHGEHRGEYRAPAEYDKGRGHNSRPDLHYRRERIEGGPYPPREAKIKGRAPTSGASERRLSDPYIEDDRKPLRSDPYYRGPEASPGDDRPRDSYDTLKPARYADPVPEVDYSLLTRDYPSYSTSRYLPPLEDPRYPPPATTRPPDTDYAALYYRDLAEWLELTGYHDMTYRQHQLRRHREIQALEESRRYGLPEDPGLYPSRPPPAPPREDPEGRPVRGPSAYAMPPPPLPGAWDDREREAAKHGLARPPSRGSTYPPLPIPKERAFRGEDMNSPDKGSLKRRISLREDEYGEPPHSAKSARHGYEGPYRRPSSIDEPNPPRRTDPRNGNEVDETEAVRQSLARRIASGRARDASPGPVSERPVHLPSRSPPPRFDVAEQTSPRYGGRGRAYGNRGEDDRGPNRGRRDSFGETPSPGRGRSYGRGRGRGGFQKNHDSYDRSQRYESRREHIGDGLDSDRGAGYTGEHARGSPTRYFMIKSFNEDNVAMAQKDNIWATQKKNADILEQAYNEARDVILFFSINKSGKFQGYARMEGPPGSAPTPGWANNLLWESSGAFRIRWISITDISFHRVAHLKNHLNEGQPVLIGRDGQEIDPTCGAQLCKTIDETAAFRKVHGPSED